MWNINFLLLQFNSQTTLSKIEFRKRIDWNQCQSNWEFAFYFFDWICVKFVVSVIFGISHSIIHPVINWMYNFFRTFLRGHHEFSYCIKLSPYNWITIWNIFLFFCLLSVLFYSLLVFVCQIDFNQECKQWPTDVSIIHSNEC